ncbi:MAG: hypothetical protein AAF755_03360 [Pseudomonadota bacterium]
MTLSARTLLAMGCFVLSLTFAASSFVTPFAGFDPNQFPVPQNNPPVQPAGYAFAIWGVIYLWLIIGSAWGLYFASADLGWHTMRVPLAISLAVGTLWLSVASVSPIWASVLIWVMLGSALVALFRAPTANQAWAALPVGLYAGWLSAASCVALGLLAAGYGWMTETTAAFSFVIVAILLGAFVQSALKRTPSYGIAVAWALFAVALANVQKEPTLASLAGGGALAMMLPTFKAWRGTPQV